MNRILYEAYEKRDGRLTLSGFRGKHVRKVLKAKPGDVFRTGEIDGPVSTGTVVEMSAERVVLEILEGETPPRPRLDLLLALPRPKVLRRLLPQIAALGVDRLTLCNASRVERCYFDTHVLEEAAIRGALMEGLTQCGDTRLPKVRVVKQLKHFVEDELSAPPDGETRWLLHPYGGESMLSASPPAGRLLLAIGPEGGWREHELELFEIRGFRRVALMDRILRSDTACVAALSLAACRLREAES